MTETQRGLADQFTEHRRDGTFERTAGIGLAAGSLVLLVGGLLHPPSTSSAGVIAADPTRWLVSHWLFAAGVFVVSVASLQLLIAGSELAADRTTVAAWATLVLGSLLLVVFMLGEATVLPHLATAGSATSFAAWRAFIEMGVIASLFPVTVALMLVAWSQARHPSPHTPAWAAWGGLLTFAVGLVWIVGFGFVGVAAIEPLFIVELVGFVWLAWLGVRLARGPAPEREPEAPDTPAAE